MYVITGATGNIGRRVAELLNPAENKVRVIGRSLERLQPLVDMGAEPFVASLDDVEAMTTAFTGATVVYLLIPPNLTSENVRSYQNKVGQVLATAVKNADVKYVVNLSSVGAHLQNGVGVVNGLYDQEQRLNRLNGVSVLHLRPTFFMENHLWQTETIKNMGFMGSAQNPDLAVPMIATEDIASYAAERLMKLDFSGKSVRELLGPRNVTMNETAQVFGKAIGKEDLKFVQFSYEDTKNALVGMGMSDDVASSMTELYHAFNEGTAQPTEERSDQNTTATTIEDFASTFAAAYNA